MKFYVRSKESGNKYLVLGQAKEENIVFFVVELKSKVILKISESGLRKDFIFDGLLD